jgi:chromosome segregation ATPase
MEAWITDNWQFISTMTAAAAALVVAVIYALNQMTRQITSLTGSMVTEVKSALGTATNDRKVELQFIQQYLEDSRETRQALTTAQHEIRTLSQTVQSQAGELAALKVQVATGRNDADHALEALSKARADAETARSSYEEQKKALMRQVADLTDEVNRLKGRVESLEEAGRQKQAALDEVTAERDRLLQRVADIDADRQQLLEQNTMLHAQLAEIRDELNQLKQRLEARDHEGNEQGVDGAADAGGGSVGVGGPGGGAGDGDGE